MKNDLNEIKKQDEYLKSNVLNMVEFVKRKNSPQFTMFLDERQQVLIDAFLRHNKVNGYAFFGGHQECERKMLGIFTSNEVDNSLFPIETIKITLPKGADVSHRDCLGAIMGLQIKREVVGDIFVKEDILTVFVSADMFSFLYQNLDKVGKYKVKLEKIDATQTVKTQEIKAIQGSVSSLRLDCIVALISNKSRTVCTQMIEKGLVKLNHVEVCSVSKPVAVNDVLVVKGKGKFIITDEIKKTKKDRLFITVNQLL